MENLPYSVIISVIFGKFSQSKKYCDYKTQRLSAVGTFLCSSAKIAQSMRTNTVRPYSANVFEFQYNSRPNIAFSAILHCSTTSSTYRENSPTQAGNLRVAEDCDPYGLRLQKIKWL